MYDSIDDLPFVCRLNLPKTALEIYRESFNEAWNEAKADKARYRLAQTHAWNEVRRHFERDRETGRWVRRAAKLKAHVARNERVETRKRSTR